VVNGKVGETKTEASRKWLPIDSRLAEALQKLQERSLHTGPQDWVFANRVGRPRSQQAILQRHLKPTALRAGIGKIGWHTFRHYSDFRTIPGETGIRSAIDEMT
jgi:integrase